MDAGAVRMQRIQNNIATSWFREADAIILARRFMGSSARGKVLSFGCSVGDELATMRTLFPWADLYGCEIDPFALDKAEQSVGHLANIFPSSSKEIRARGPYDMICAFSSLCLNPPPTPDLMRERFSFSAFEDVIGLLDDNLNVGGMLCLRNTSYAFTMTAIARTYDRIRSDGFLQNGFIPIFRAEGGFALSTINGPSGPIHRIENVDCMDDWDFIDSVFQKTHRVDDIPHIKWHRSSWSRPELPFEQVGSWKRSNLDVMSTDVRGLLEISQDYRTFFSFRRPDAVFVERDTARLSVRTGTMISMNSAGWWV